MKNESKSEPRRILSKKSLPFVAIGISVLYAIVLLVGNSTLLGAVWIVLGILLSILMGLVAWMAGVAVIQSLFIVAAELSLLIFLTQSFCASSTRLVQNNSAMTSLFTVGLIYIIFIFFRSLWDVLKTNYKKIENRPRSAEKIITIIAFILFVILFLNELYLVIYPIFSSLCVYR